MKQKSPNYTISGCDSCRGHKFAQFVLLLALVMWSIVSFPLSSEFLLSTKKIKISTHNILASIRMYCKIKIRSPREGLCDHLKRERERLSFCLL